MILSQSDMIGLFGGCVGCVFILIVNIPSPSVAKASIASVKT